jgi:hypothetical protein
MFTSTSAVGTATSTTASADAAIRVHAIGSPSATKHSARYAAAVAAGIVLFGLLSPTTATARQKVSAPTELSVSAIATNDASYAVVGKPGPNGGTALTSHLPWLAPIGHRQPRRADVPQDADSSARERRPQLLDLELDQKLIICRC